MAMFMDIHHMKDGVTEEDVAGAHAMDVAIQEKYDVDYKHYWVDDTNGKIFCLVEAPDAETAIRVNREADGLEADEIYPVTQGA